MSRRRARWAVLPIALAIVVSTAASASAYTVTANVRGGGTVAEVGGRSLMSCTSDAGAAESTTTPCVAGTAGGLYSWGDVVTLRASVPDEHFNRGWRFQKWVDSAAGGGRINCDPQGTAGDHTSIDCRFQVFENLRVDLYFDDVAGPQDTSITSGPASLTKSTSATFGFAAASDPGAHFECKLDLPGQPGGYAACGSPVDKSESYGGLSANGAYAFSVRAKDPSGNLDSTPATWSWTVDTIAPTVSIGGTPGHNSVTTSTSTAFTVTASEPGTSLACTFDGSPASCSGPATVGEGTHSFTARATDPAGNVGPLATRTWTVDTSAPAVAIAGSPADGATTSSTTAAFTVTADPGTRSCTLDGAPVADCDAPISGLGPGAHTFVAEVTDAGGTGSASRSWTVDTSDPVVTIAGEPADGATTASGTALFNATADEPAALTCALDGATRACGAAIAGLADGEHTFSATAVDAAGNSGGATRTWTVDTVAPNTGITGGPAEGAATDASAAFTFVSTEAGASFACRLDGGAWAPCTTPHLLEGLANGEHVFEVRAGDAAGNTDATPARRSWRVGSVDPGTGPGGGPSELSVIPAKLERKWRVRGRRTILRRLRLTTLPDDALATVRCKGRRCPVKKRSGRPDDAGVVDLRKLLRRRPLRAGQRITITVTAPGRVTRVIVLRPRKGKAPKGGAVLCLPAGATEPAGC